MPFAQIGDLNLHYLERPGTGDPLLLIHGNTSSSVWWQYTVDRLADTSYHIIAPDLRGRGDTTGPDDAWTIETLAADVFGLMQHLKLDAAHVVGHSLGGLVAVQYALDHKAVLKSLTLIAPGWMAGDMPGDISDPARIRMLVENKALLKMALRAIAAKHPAEGWDVLEAASMKQTDAAHYRNVAALKPFNVAARLGELAGVPALVLRGAGDPVIPESVVMIAVKGIPGARFVEIPGATHSPNVETPDMWVRLLKDHLSGGAAPVQSQVEKEKQEIKPLMPIPTLPGVTAKHIKTARIGTRVLFSGPDNGTPVVFVHGNASCATFWEEIMVGLPTGFRAIAPDLRGYGEADRDKKINALNNGTGDWVDDLEALLVELKIDQAHFVGHSMGGAILWEMLCVHPGRFLTATLVAPGSPYGYGGTKDLIGTPCHTDFAGSGGGIVNPEFARLMGEGNRAEDNPQASPRIVMNTFFWKPPFRPAREEDLLSALLSEHVGPDGYPGDSVPSPNYPFVAPGQWGPINALSPKHMKPIERLFQIDPKPPILWIRGDHDQIIADQSLFDYGTLGALGLIPNYPGVDVHPSQPMASQTRAVLEKYRAAGGWFKEVVIENTGHTPYVEKPTEFNQHLHTHLKK